MEEEKDNDRQKKAEIKVAGVGHPELRRDCAIGPWETWWI